MKHLTVAEQLLSGVSIETFKEHLRSFGVPFRKAFRLEYLLVLPINRLLDYGADISIEDDHLLSCHRSMIKLREQLKQHNIEVLQFSLDNDFKHQLWIRCHHLRFGFIQGYQSYLDELISFANGLDQLNIPDIFIEIYIPILEGEERINLWGSYDVEEYELQLQQMSTNDN